jgi:F420-non-reducing hydrogenase iron-sulfur subunit
MMPQFKPNIIFYCCEWNPYIGADNAGAQAIQYPANIKIIPVNCSGRITPKLILNAFEYGADAVLIGACGKGECHYVTGNKSCENVVKETADLLQLTGIDPQRLEFELFSDISGEHFVSIVTKFNEKISQAGPLSLKEAA